MHGSAWAIFDDVNHKIITSVEILLQSAAITAATIGVSRVTALAVLLLPAIPHDANVYIVSEFFGEPLECLGLRPIHHYEFHVS
jgi:hypothetical protein